MDKVMEDQNQVV